MAYIYSGSLRWPWPWCKVIVAGRQRKTISVELSRQLKQANKHLHLLEWYAGVVVFLRYFDFEKVYMAWPTCFFPPIFVLFFFFPLWKSMIPSSFSLSRLKMVRCMPAAVNGWRKMRSGEETYFRTPHAVWVHGYISMWPLFSRNWS